MSEIILNILAFALLPTLATIAGSAIAAYWPPGSKLRSIIQHFAAGVVFSVVAVELLPDIVKEHNATAAAIGFALGVATMLGLKTLTGVAEKAPDDPTKKAPETVSSGLVFSVGIDILVDGFLIGIGFAAGANEGKLLTLALTIELLSLGLALASSLAEAGATKAKIIGIISGLSTLILVGAAIGATVLQSVSKEVLEIVLSFGLAALLFLVTEELLVEAHEEPETPFITSTFFAGFLLFLVLGIIA